MLKKNTILVLLLAVIMTAAFGVSALGAGYSDTENHWASAQIEKWSDAGILQGSNGQFRPADPITRGEMAIILDRIMNYQVKSRNTFGDLPGGAYFTDAILKANASGVILGDAGKVRPKDYITRQEAAVMLGRAFGLTASENTASNFTDKANIASWASSMVLTMEQKGFIGGTDGKFLPKNNISRAEVVKIVDNMVKGFITEAGTYTSNVAGTLVVNTPNTVLKNITVTGDLLIAAGVGEGEITLDGVTVKGNVVVKGGGVNSIVIKGNSDIGKVLVAKVGNKVRVVTEGGADVAVVVVEDGSDDVVLTGSFGDVQVAAADVVVNAVGATITNAKIDGEGSKVQLDAKSTVTKLTLSASGAEVNGDKGAVVKTVVAESTASGAKIKGDITVQNAEVKANNVAVDTVGTKVTVATGVSGTTSNGSSIAAGTTVTTTAAAPTGTSGGSSGGTQAVSAVTITTDPVDVTDLACNETVTVTLTTATAGATIYYTMDGTAPTTASSVYDSNNKPTGAKLSGGTVVFKAIAVKAGMSNSAVATKNIVFNATKMNVDTAADLKTAIENNAITTINVIGDITGDVTATRADSNNFTINFSTNSLTGNLNITAASVTAIAFNGTAIPAITGNLTVSAANATVTNNVNVGGTITVADVGDHSWVEVANGNTITLTDDNGATIEIQGNPEDITIEAGAGGGISITASSPVNITVANGATVDSITAAAAGTTITNNGTVTAVTANADIAIANNSGSITVAGTGTVGASGTASANVTGTATIVTGITDLAIDQATLRIGATTAANITTAVSGNSYHVTSASPTIVSVDAATGLAITALKPGKAAITVQVKNAEGTVTHQGTIFVTVLPAQISAASATMAAPVAGATPQTAAQIETATANGDYTVTGITWNQALTAAGKFKAGQAYTATVVLTSKNEKAFQAAAFTPTVLSADTVGTTTTVGTAVGNRVSFTVTFPATDALTVTGIAVTTQPTKMSYAEATDGVLALSGMVVRETNNDGTTNTVTFTDGTAVGYTANPANGATLTNATHNGTAVTITHTATGKTATTNTLTVAALKEITAAKAIANVNAVANDGTTLASVKTALGATVTLLAGAEEVAVPVTWSADTTPAYNNATAATYVLTGTIGSLPLGYVDATDTIATVSVNIVVAPAPASDIDVTLQGIYATTEKMVICIFKTEEIDPSDPTTREIPSLSASDFILIKDFGTPGQTTIPGIRLEVDPMGGTWEYDILPALAQTFASGNYRLAFNKNGYAVAHVDFEVMSDAGKVAAAKAAIAGASYTNLAVADTSDEAQKLAAVQAVVDAVKGDTTAVVTADGGNFSVAISLNAASDTASITTATFVSNNTTLTTNAPAVVTDITGTVVTVVGGTYTQALVDALVAPTAGSFELQNADGSAATLDLDTTGVVNTMKIVVTAENGTEAIYTITVV